MILFIFILLSWGKICTKQCNVILIFYTHDLWTLFRFLITRPHLHKKMVNRDITMLSLTIHAREIFCLVDKRNNFSPLVVHVIQFFIHYNEMHPVRKWESRPSIQRFSCIDMSDLWTTHIFPSHWYTCLEKSSKERSLKVKTINRC